MSVPSNHSDSTYPEDGVTHYKSKGPRRKALHHTVNYLNRAAGKLKQMSEGKPSPKDKALRRRIAKNDKRK